jgi:hypothetical protein
VTDIGIVCGLNIAGCVVVDWRGRQALVQFVDCILLAVKW